MIFGLFKNDAEKHPKDVKSLRDVLLRFIKEELQKVEGGEGKHIKALNLFITAEDDQKFLYEAAVYQHEPERFKDEVQKLADDYALDLPSSWVLETIFSSELPHEAIKSRDLNAALFIQTKKHTIQKTAVAYIRVLSGEAEKGEYFINSADPKVTIGREKRAQVDDGFFRVNTIAFPGDSENECNKYISRQHAHIEWNNDAGCFMLFGDEGGIPPRNKIKIRTAVDENLIKLNSTHIGHRLSEGDQIILGESAVIEFSYHSNV